MFCYSDQLGNMKCEALTHSIFYLWAGKVELTKKNNYKCAIAVANTSNMAHISVSCCPPSLEALLAFLPPTPGQLHLCQTHTPTKPPKAPQDARRKDAERGAKAATRDARPRPSQECSKEQRAPTLLSARVTASTDASTAARSVTLASTAASTVTLASTAARSVTLASTAARSVT